MGEMLIVDEHLVKVRMWRISRLRITGAAVTYIDTTHIVG
jgi:hypothetical protein